MNIFSFPHKADAGNEKTKSEEIRETIHTYPHEINIADGGEFLDDGIRMKDEPYGETAGKEKD